MRATVNMNEANVFNGSYAADGGHNGGLAFLPWPELSRSFFSF